MRRQPETKHAHMDTTATHNTPSQEVANDSERNRVDLQSSNKANTNNKVDVPMQAISNPQRDSNQTTYPRYPTPETQTSTTQHPPTLCHYFTRGTCTNGQECNFIHPSPQLYRDAKKPSFQICRQYNPM